jgi:hypothetical protein
MDLKGKGISNKHDFVHEFFFFFFLIKIFIEIINDLIEIIKIIITICVFDCFTTSSLMRDSCTPTSVKFSSAT